MDIEKYTKTNVKFEVSVGSKGEIKPAVKIEVERFDNKQYSVEEIREIVDKDLNSAFEEIKMYLQKAISLYG